MCACKKDDASNSSKYDKLKQPVNYWERGTKFFASVCVLRASVVKFRFCYGFRSITKSFIKYPSPISSRQRAQCNPCGNKLTAAHNFPGHLQANRFRWISASFSNNQTGCQYCPVPANVHVNLCRNQLCHRSDVHANTGSLSA